MHTYRIKIILCLFILLGGGVLYSDMSASKAASLKISYLGKTRYYSGKRINTSINKKTVTKGKTKGLIINKTNMVSYKDVFQKGAGAVCTYLPNSKKITIQQNGVTIQMWLNKKKAFVNGVKKTMTQAPTKVRYYKKKKSVILVPAKFISTHLQYKYSWASSSSKINLTSPFKIYYSGKDTYYKGYQGRLNYNNKSYKLSTMPALSIDGATFVPAQEVFEKRMGMNYLYEADAKRITIQEPETGKTVVFMLDSTDALVGGKVVKLSTSPKLIKRYDTNQTVVCVPSNFTAKRLGYFYKWDKLNLASVIHKKSYFLWNETQGRLESEYQEEEQKTFENAIVSMSANYDFEKSTMVIEMKGMSNEIMSAITVDKEGNFLSITIPSTIYDLAETEYTKFGSVLKKLAVEQQEDRTIISVESAIDGKALDYSYSLEDNVFMIQILDDYTGNYAVKIGKPAGVTFDMVSNIDYYNSKKFAVIIKGNHLAYFKTNPVVIGTDVIKSVDVSLNSTKNTVITIATAKLQGYKIYDKSNSFVVNINSPRKIYSKIVVLDAGHGGHDPGAVSNGMKEKNSNFKMMVTLMKPYFTSNAPDIKVYWTRSTDTFITLNNRAGYAKKMGADIFVSLHMNASLKKSVNGTEVYYSSANNKSSFSGLTSKKMASLFLKRLVQAMGTKSRGIYSQKYVVVHKNTVPSVLLELGFLTGSSDSLKIKNLSYQKKATKAIYDTITEIFKTYPTGRK